MLIFLLHTNKNSNQNIFKIKIVSFLWKLLQFDKMIENNTMV